MIEEGAHPKYILNPVPTGAVSARTLITLRWVAIVGQMVAILVVEYGLKFSLPLYLCISIILAAAIFNLFMQASSRTHPRLSDQSAALSLGWDIAQSTALLFVTGGMANPFALLLLAPVTVSATILSLRSTIWLCLLALSAATILMLIHLPLPWQKTGIQLPTLYIFGIWTALIIAIFFIAAYTWRVADEARRMTNALAATQIALAREQQISALGGLAAAAAHELGTPLSTIAVVTAELSRDVPSDSEFSSDIELLRSESDRCAEILARLSHKPDIENPAPFDHIPISTLVELAATPHQRDSVEIIIEQHTQRKQSDRRIPNSEPLVTRRPEMLHGLSTLVENASQFAKTTVEVTIGWNDDEATILIEDDGPGFSPAVLDRLGEPYLSTRRNSSNHMGLGIFIAKTLLERTGGQLVFGNRPDNGASVTARWLRSSIEPNPN